MMADEGAQQLVVEPVGCGDNLLELKLGRDVEIVAHVARLEIKIDQRDPGAFGRLVFHEMDGGFDGEGRIADASRARRERNHDRRIGRASSLAGRADASDNVENFLRQSGLGDPVGVAGLNEPLVVARGNVAANHDEEQVSRIAPDDVDQIVDVRASRGAATRMTIERSAPLIDFRIDVFDVAKRA